MVFRIRVVAAIVCCDGLIYIQSFGPNRQPPGLRRAQLPLDVSCLIWEFVAAAPIGGCADGIPSPISLRHSSRSGMELSMSHSHLMW